MSRYHTHPADVYFCTLSLTEASLNHLSYFSNRLIQLISNHKYSISSSIKNFFGIETFLVSRLLIQIIKFKYFLQNIVTRSQKYPKSVFFILGTEFCERFSYYGMRGKSELQQKNTITAVLFIHHTLAITNSYINLAGVKNLLIKVTFL